MLIDAKLGHLKEVLGNTKVSLKNILVLLWSY